MVIFPQQMTRSSWDAKASVRALEEALAGDKKIFLSTQHMRPSTIRNRKKILCGGHAAEHRTEREVAGRKHQSAGRGVERARAVSVATEEGFFRATVGCWSEGRASPQVERRLRRYRAYEHLSNCAELNYDTMIAAARVDDSGAASDTIAAICSCRLDEKQDLLDHGASRTTESHRRFWN